MKRASLSKKRDRTALPGQLDLFGVGGGSGAEKTLPDGAGQNPPAQKGKNAARDLIPANRAQSKALPIVDLMDTPSAARKLGLGVSTLEKMRRQRRGPPYIKIARNLVRYRVADLEAWIASRVQH